LTVLEIFAKNIINVKNIVRWNKTKDGRGK